MNTQCWKSQFAGLTRRTDQAKIAGVCAGLAAHFGWQIKGVRIAMIALCIFVPPLGFGLYFLLAILLPQAGGGRDHTSSFVAPPPPPPAPFAAGHRADFQPTPVSTHDARERVRSLEERLREMEAYMTSSRYEFDRQLRNSR